MNHRDNVQVTSQNHRTEHLASASSDDVPTVTEIISQAVNGDIVRILNTQPPEPLVWATRLEITRRALAVLTALATAGTLAALVWEPATLPTVVAINVCVALVFLGSYMLTIIYSHSARLAILEKYAVLPNQDGVFELLGGAPPHQDMAATRETMREYGRYGTAPANHRA